MNLTSALSKASSEKSVRLVSVVLFAVLSSRSAHSQVNQAASIPEIKSSAAASNNIRIQAALSLLASIEGGVVPVAPANSKAASTQPQLPVNSLEWHLDIAQKMAAVAVWLKNNGGATDATAAGTRALAHVALALQQADSSKPKSIARVHDVEGMINEDILGNRAQAILAYKAAKSADDQDQIANARLANLGD